MGLPFEHGLQTTLIAVRLGEWLGIDSRTASEAYYASLLAHSGCTTEAWVAAEVFGGSLTTHLSPVLFGSPGQQFAGLLRALPNPDSALAARAVQVARRLPRAGRLQKPQLAALCEVAETLSGQPGLPESVQRLFRNTTERWDGKGVLGRAEREEIPLAMRITHVAMDAAVHRCSGARSGWWTWFATARVRRSIPRWLPAWSTTRRRSSPSTVRHRYGRRRWPMSRARG
jgi:hypothetical protein